MTVSSALEGGASPTGPEPLEPHDARRASTPFVPWAGLNDLGVLEAADVHVARRLCGLAEEVDPLVALAVALAVRALRAGSVCVDLADLGADPVLAGLSLPASEELIAAVSASRLRSPRAGAPAVLHLHEGRLLYLDRYWREEEQVCADLLDRLSRCPPALGIDLSAALDRVFPSEGYDEQRAAARIALEQGTTVLTGGPGTGKTTTVAALLALLVEQAEAAGRPHPRIALAAPTGKAAARLQEAVAEEVARLPVGDRTRLTGLRALTLHRLLGVRPTSSTRFRHDRDNRLPHDVIVVDEVSMVSLTMMARLLEAVRPQTRLVLVGDPDQLTSVEAGAVLGDLVRGLGVRADHRVAALRTSHRFGTEIRALAEAVRDGDGETAVAVLRAGGEHVEFVEQVAEPGDPPATGPGPAQLARLRSLLVPHARALVTAAEAGDAAGALDLLDRRRLLCAHRDGPYGVRRFNDLVERWLADEPSPATAGSAAAGFTPYAGSGWYAGRPLLVSANDYGLGVYNGDVGICVRGSGGMRAHVAAVGAPVEIPVSRLGDVETMHAMTIHKSQGSQADTVVVLLPPADSRLLTRELLYTAITRARGRVVVVGTEADVRAAVARRALRATGLEERLARSAAESS